MIPGIRYAQTYGSWVMSEILERYEILTLFFLYEWKKYESRDEQEIVFSLVMYQKIATLSVILCDFKLFRGLIERIWNVWDCGLLRLRSQESNLRALSQVPEGHFWRPWHLVDDLPAFRTQHTTLSKLCVVFYQKG